MTPEAEMKSRMKRVWKIVDPLLIVAMGGNAIWAANGGHWLAAYLSIGWLVLDNFAALYFRRHWERIAEDLLSALKARSVGE